MGMTFANPEYFFLLLLIPVMIFWYWKRERHQLAEIQMSTVQFMRSVPRTWRQRLRHFLFIARVLAFALLFFLQRDVRLGRLGRFDLGRRLRRLRWRPGRLGWRFRRLGRRLRRDLFRRRRSIELDAHRFLLGVLPGDAENQEDDET